MDKSKNVLSYFPEYIKEFFASISDNQWKILNEICFICGQPITVTIGGIRRYLGKSGTNCDVSMAYKTNKNDISRIFELVTKSSLYAYKRFVTNGYTTLDEGHRVGICGDCVVENDKVINVNNINSLTFRITHDIIVNSEVILDEIYADGRILNAIIISPPGCGKTTFLRSVSAAISQKQKDSRIIKCAIIDERYEIAACKCGFQGMNVGYVSAVISGCPRNIAIPMAVRSMSPDVILTDELSSNEDILAIKYAKASGCSIIATTHGLDENNNELKHFNLEGVFDKIFILSRANGPGTIEKVLNGDMI